MEQKSFLCIFRKCDNWHRFFIFIWFKYFEKLGPPLLTIWFFSFGYDFWDDVYADFRFLKNDIRRLRTAFRLSNKIICGFYSDLCNDSVEMCILLKRLAYSNRYSDTISLLRRTFPWLSVDKIGNSWTWEHGVTFHDVRCNRTSCAQVHELVQSHCCSQNMHNTRVSYHKMCYLRQFVNLSAKTYVFSHKVKI